VLGEVKSGAGRNGAMAGVMPPQQMGYSDWEATERQRRDHERREYEEAEHQRREAERRAYAHQFEVSRREFDRQETTRRQNLEAHLMQQQERLSSLWQDVGRKQDAGLVGQPLSSEAAASFGPASSCQTPGLQGYSTSLATPGAAGQPSPYCVPSCAMSASSHPPQQVIYVGQPPASGGRGTSRKSLPPSRPPSVATLRRRQQEPAAATYTLAAPGDFAHPTIGEPYPYELPTGARSAGCVVAAATPNLRHTPSMSGGHQAPPEVLQLWLAPPRRVAPKRPKSRGKLSSRGRIDPRLVGHNLVRPGSAPVLDGQPRRGRRSKSPAARPRLMNIAPHYAQ